MGHGGKRKGAGRKPRQRDAVPPAIVSPTRPVFTPIAGGSGEPPEPDWSILFSDELDIALAHEQWGLLLRELRDSEKLASANAHQLKRLVLSYVIFERAARNVAEVGAVVKGKRGAAKANPWFQVFKDANAMAQAAEAELTITPRRRNNGGKVSKKNRPEGGAVGYLRSLAAK